MFNFSDMDKVKTKWDILNRYIDLKGKTRNERIDITGKYFLMRFEHGCKFHDEYNTICLICLQKTIKRYPQISLLNDNLFDILDRNKKELKEKIKLQEGQTTLNQKDFEFLGLMPSSLPSEFSIVDKSGKILISGHEKTEIIIHDFPKNKNQDREYMFYQVDGINKIMLSVLDTSDGLYAGFGLNVGNHFAPFPVDITQLKLIRNGVVKCIRRLEGVQKRK